MNQPTTTTARLTRHVLVVTGVAVTITMAIATVVMSTALGPRVVIPGPLSAGHALLTDNCANCHGAEMGSTKGVLHGMVNSGLSLRDSSGCLGCHDLGADALHAHSMAPVALAAYTEKVNARPGSDARAPTGFALPPHSEGGEYACAVCHVEHRGRLHDLKLMTGAQCQSCHSERFDGFHEGHPEFGGYPYTRRLQIGFDHASHIYHNFLTNEPGLAPASCTDCHGTDPTGDFMLTASFERSCAACHEKDTRGTARSGGTGVAFLSLPAIDTVAFEDAGIGIGQWPADSAIAEGGITPFVRLLLSGDAAIAEDLRIVDSLDLLDLSGVSGARLEAVARVVWAIKSLLREITDGGHDAIVRRVERAVGPGAGGEPPSMLTGSLSRSLVRSSIAAWLPDLERELAQRAIGAEVPTDALEDARFEEINATGQGWSTLGGWYRDDMAFAIKHRPTGHGDPFLRAWADLAASEPTAGAALLEAFAREDAVGQCFKCHSVDRAGPSSLRVNWLARRPGDTAGDLTRFSHAPHLPLLGDDGCLRCHGIDPQPRAFELSYRQHDPGVFVSVLAPMNRARCAECHTPSRVSTTCLDCHDYHARRPATRLRGGAPLKPTGGEGGIAGDGAAPIE